MRRRSPDDTITDTITLREAAEELGVHYMTAYRYVRLGRLEAQQVGGHWFVRRGDLARIGEAAEPGGRRGGPSWARYRERLLPRLLDGDEAGAWATIESAIAAGAAPERVYLDVLAPCLHEIGSLWHRGTIDVADEHRAAAVATRIVGRMGPRFAHRGRRRAGVVIGGAPGDPHALPVAILADVLRGARFRVVDLGANTPPSAFVKACSATDDIRAVGVSVSTNGARDGAASAIAAVHTAKPGLMIMAGGPALRSRRAALALGAHDWASDARGAAMLLDDIAPPRRGPR